MLSPFTVTLYDKACVRRGWIGDYEQLTATPRHNATGTGSLTVRSDHHLQPLLLADGTRMVVEYAPDPVVPGTKIQVLSGPIDVAQGTLPLGQNPTTITVQDDLVVLDQVLAWPVPGAAISAQSAQAYDTRTGPAESVIKAYVTANAVTRLGLPLVVATNLGRGPAVSARGRMDKLSDLLLPLADAAGLGISVRQVSGRLELDVYRPTVRTRVLTEESGVLVSGAWTRTRPRATDVIVGGQGEATARKFRLVRDTALAAAHGTRIEVFRDATDVATDAELDARGALTLAEGRPGAGISLQLAETSSWRYGRTVHVGDVVPVQIAPGVVVTEIIRAAVLTHGRDQGVTISPRVGDDTAGAEPNAVLAKALSRVAAAVRQSLTRK